MHTLSLLWCCGSHIFLPKVRSETCCEWLFCDCVGFLLGRHADWGVVLILIFCAQFSLCMLRNGASSIPLHLQLYLSGYFP